MARIRTGVWVATIALLAVVFGSAGAGKLLDEGGVLISPIVWQQGHLFHEVSMILERSLPLLEIVVAFGLISGIGRDVAASSCVILSGIFVGYSRLVPDGMSCGCFGLLGGIESQWHLPIALVILVMSICALVGSLRSRSIGGFEPEVQRPGS